MADKPKIVDDDRNTISVMLGDRELQAWLYADEADRREKMRHAWYFCDGFMCGRGAEKTPPKKIAAE